MNFADRMSRLGTENAFEVLAEVKKLEAQGRDVVSFAIGEPDFDTPEHIKEAAIRAMAGNETHYAPSAGILPLREEIASYVARTRNIEVHPDEVVVTPGAKPIMFFTIQALVNPGDEVIYPTPGFPIYESLIRFVGGHPVPVPLLEERNFSFDVEYLAKLITPKTKLIILNSPQNPTGGMLSYEDLRFLSELAVQHDLWVLADEIYSRIVYSGEFHSISSFPGMKERTVILDGFSKTYAMTGWRLGYGVMNRRLAELVARLVTNSESCTNTFVQYGGIAALTGPQDAVTAMVAEFKARRDLIVEELNRIPGVKCLVPGGAFYVYPNVSGVCQNLGFASAKELQQHFLHAAGVAVLPRTAFGSRTEHENGEYIRLSYATSREKIREGISRMREAVERA
ncbi:pyridoxal phosphate-dependent aminotransferase [Alicyclobacillus tolerans]|uniref:pyridoxal phosphate-dependent aminotransferase n=1 Tax=Alicyclobacillus tolerans TaxID=90970 RepID=UPI001F196B35|nr:pyridoxal phosphate-dependent aminotransferase [Alicyclobacillus tolerans]MCF8565823.1 pyridoxal phosphate-dependent aminotransferase [Alicyclobacillus tolerans]